METLYKEFTDSGRELSRPEFDSYYKKAKNYIDYLTFARINYDDEKLVQKANECILELIKFEYDENKKFESQYKTDGLKSETIGSQRVDYLTVTMADLRSLKRLKENEYYMIVKRYFGLTGLMYRGL